MTAIGIPPRPSGEWEWPLEQVADELTALKEQRTKAALLAEQRHQLLDLDPDSAFTLPGSCCVNCPPKGGTS